MKNVKLIHVSFDEVENFTPRVPQQRCLNEDETIPRICVAPTIRNALSAIPQAGEVIYYMERLHLSIIIHAYYIESNSVLMPKELVDKVPDAMWTKEMWVTKVPDAVRRVDFELVNPVIAKRKDVNGTCRRKKFMDCLNEPFLSGGRSCMTWDIPIIIASVAQKEAWAIGIRFGEIFQRFLRVGQDWNGK